MLARHKSSTIDYHFVLLIRLLKELRNGQSGWKDFYCYQSNGASGVHSVRHLRQAGAYVRALTRNPRSKKAKQIAALGAELVTGNMEKPETLTTLFQGATGVYSVQNPYTSSIAAEVQQRKIVAIAANLAGITHFIQASAGLGKKNGVPSWDSKLEIEEYIRSLGLHLPIFRPMAFMELITDSSYYPMVSTFHHMPRLMGADKKVVWLAVDDLCAIAARVFANPDKYIGQDLKLTSELQSINEVRAPYQQVMGKKPPHFPMPEFMFRMFTGDDLIIMWKYLNTTTLNITPETTLAILPKARTIHTWLDKQKSIDL